MKAEKSFKYSPDGFNIVEINEGEEIPPGRALEIAGKLGAIGKKSAKHAANKSMRPTLNK